MVVPRTAHGYMLPNQLPNQHCGPTPGSQQKSSPKAMLMASSITRKGYELVSNKTAYGTSTNSLQQQPAGTVEGDIFTLCGTYCERIQHAYALGYEQSFLKPLPWQSYIWQAFVSYQGMSGANSRASKDAQAARWTGCWSCMS